MSLTNAKRYVRRIVLITFISIVLNCLVAVGDTVSENHTSSNVILINRSRYSAAGIFEANSILVIDAETATELQITSFSRNLSAMRWSNDRSYLLVRDLDSSPISPLGTLEVSTGKYEILTDLPALTANWSSDDEHILFWGRDSNEENWAIYNISRDGSDLRRLTHFMTRGGLAVSPVDDQILFTSDGKLFKMSLDGNHLTQIESSLHFSSILAWSPNGSTVVVVVYTDYDRTTSELELHLLNPNDGSSRLLFTNGNSIRNVHWSPDGSHILFLVPESNTTSIGITSVETGLTHIYHPGQGALSEIGVILQARWSPDSTQIALSAPSVGENPPYMETGIFVVDRSITHIRSLSLNNRDDLVQWATEHP